MRKHLLILAVVGFTGWIGGVAVFDRALSMEELKRLSDFRVTPLVTSFPTPSKP